MRFSIIILLLGCPAFSVGYDLNGIVLKASQDIQEELEKEFAKGKTSLESSKRKRTPVSRAMDARNDLYMRSVELLEKEVSSLSESDRSEVFARLDQVKFTDFSPSRNDTAEDRWFIKHTYFVDDLCGKAPIDCTQEASSLYRTIDGVCNNVANPLWGAANIPLKRDINPAYHNLDQNTPRGGNNPNRLYGFRPVTYWNCFSNYAPNLPNPRLVSRNFHVDRNLEFSNITYMVTQFGQFLDHDITMTVESNVDNCCSGNFHRDCFEIRVPNGDPFIFSSCLEFPRSTAFCLSTSTYREQMNGITAFVDASNVYGSDRTTANSLRSFRDGKLKVTVSFARKELLPILFSSENNENEFTGGDSRARENPGLTSLHTLFLREHNRLATEIKEKKSFWSDEEIYQLARRIVGAEMQNIVYGEFLPIILGSDVMKRYNLNIDGQDFSQYSSTIDPSIRNMFATAAYRFGHSLVQGIVRVAELWNPNFGYFFRLSTSFFNSQQYVASNGFNLEKLIYGMTHELAQRVDRYVSGELTNNLFKDAGRSFGSDLVSRNIQRGRDHGIPGYNEVREWCELPKLCSWNSNHPDFEDNDWDRLKFLYDNPGDMDLFTAGIAEKPVPGGVVGPTFSCIISKQFQRLKFGDRYFFTHSGQAGSFTADQLNHLKSRRLSDIICENTEIPNILANTFKADSAKISCSTQRNVLDINKFI